VTDKKITLAEDIGINEINPYEPIDSNEESESGNEKSHFCGSNESDSDD